MLRIVPQNSSSIRSIPLQNQQKEGDLPTKRRTAHPPQGKSCKGTGISPLGVDAAGRCTGDRGFVSLGSFRTPEAKGSVHRVPAVQCDSSAHRDGCSPLDPAMPVEPQPTAGHAAALAARPWKAETSRDSKSQP